MKLFLLSPLMFSSTVFDPWEHFICVSICLATRVRLLLTTQKLGPIELRGIPSCKSVLRWNYCRCAVTLFTSNVVTQVIRFHVIVATDSCDADEFESPEMMFFYLFKISRNYLKMEVKPQMLIKQPVRFSRKQTRVV